MWQITLVLLSSLCLWPVWLKPAAEEQSTASSSDTSSSSSSSMNAADVLQLIEQALTHMSSRAHGASESQTPEQQELPPSWIDALLNSYVQSGTPENISEGVVSILLRHSAVDEKFKGVMLRQFSSSKSFIKFALQEYSLVKEGLLEWFVTSKDFRSRVLQGLRCSELDKLLDAFVSSLPQDVLSYEDFADKHPFAWKILHKWSEDSCFKSALLGGLIVSDHFSNRIELLVSHSTDFTKGIVLGFINSQYFVESLVTKYTVSDHLLSHLQRQLEILDTFRDYLFDKLVEDESFRQSTFEYLLTIELNATKEDLKKMILNQAVESSKFREALFEQILADSKFKEAILSAFITVQKFQHALVRTFARSDDFRREVNASQTVMDDALELFEDSESFRNEVLEVIDGHRKMRMNG